MTDTAEEAGPMTADEIDPPLMHLLRQAGEEYGPLGVALAAASLTDRAALLRKLSEGPATEPDGVPAGQPARVGINGYQSYTGRVSEVTRFGAQFGRVACPDGEVVEFPPGSVHSITWLSEEDYRAAVTVPRAALPVGNTCDADEEEPW